MKKWFKFGFLSLLFGWFPFMWIAVWGSWNRDIGIIVLLIGIFFCFMGTLSILPLLMNDDLFKKIEQLEEEKLKYFQATQKLLNKIKDL